jgi:uncharacterized membrane protein YagU involved in acid resistance
VDPRRLTTARRAGRDVTAVVESGIAAGLIGGLAMLGFIIARAVIGGIGWWAPLQTIGAAIDGPEALYGGPRAIAGGLFLHFAFSIAWGLVYAALVRRSLTPGVSLFVGVVFGAGVWFVMTFVVIPAINPMLREQASADPLMFFLAYLVYGAGVSVSPMIARAFHRRHLARAVAA